jgi:hypothetical protein
LFFLFSRNNQRRAQDLPIWKNASRRRTHVITVPGYTEIKFRLEKV